MGLTLWDGGTAVSQVRPQGRGRSGGTVSRRRLLHAETQPQPLPRALVSHLLPEDGVGLVAAHGQGVPLEAEVDGGVVVADVGHVLKGGAWRPRGQGHRPKLGPRCHLPIIGP